MGSRCPGLRERPEHTREVARTFGAIVVPRHLRHDAVVEWVIPEAVLEQLCGIRELRNRLRHRGVGSGAQSLSKTNRGLTFLRQHDLILHLLIFSKFLESEKKLHVRKQMRAVSRV